MRRNPEHANSRIFSLSLNTGSICLLFLQADFLRRADDANLGYLIEFAYTIKGTVAPLVALGTDLQRVILNDRVTTATSSRRFGRIRLTYPRSGRRR